MKKSLFLAVAISAATLVSTVAQAELYVPPKHTAEEEAFRKADIAAIKAEWAEYKAEKHKRLAEEIKQRHQQRLLRIEKRKVEWDRIAKSNLKDQEEPKPKPWSRRDK